MGKSSIEWTDETWNPTSGCSKVSQGCKNCYAERVFPRAYSKDTKVISGHLHLDRSGREGFEAEVKRKFTDVRTHPNRLDQPLRWRKPRRVFVDSMSDLFHEDIPDEFIDQVFAVMALCPQHTFQILTKRPERMRDYMGADSVGLQDRINSYAGVMMNFDDMPERFDWPLDNVWLGCSVEDQATADERIPLLLQTPAAVRFLSCEPLLGAIDLDRGCVDLECMTSVNLMGQFLAGPGGCKYNRNGEHSITSLITGETWNLPKIDWVIAGGESGSKARPMHPDWARSLRDQCQAAGVPFFFKQWGEWHPSNSHDPDHCKCDFMSVHRNGHTETRPLEAAELAAPASGLDWCGVCKIGKKAAGALLDGREHREFPG